MFMRIWMIRHGDPDYEHDTLTGKGKREAQLLSDRVVRENVKAFYVSPLGRAKDTAEYTLKRLGRSAVVMDWLKEFPVQVDINASELLQKAYPDTRQEDGRYVKRIAWDMLPGSWREIPEYSDTEKWKKTEVADHSDLTAVYDQVSAGLDALLEAHGYRRDGKLYRTEEGNNDTIVLFCHFGVTCVMLSHLWNVSPFVLWHSLVMAPTSVTEIYTEEREKGIVTFRASKIGDTAHLYVGNEPPSFSARFCETYENKEERH